MSKKIKHIHGKHGYRQFLLRKKAEMHLIQLAQPSYEPESGKMDEVKRA